MTMSNFFQTSSIQHTCGSGPSREAALAIAASLHGCSAVLQECPRWVITMQHPDNVLQAATQPGGMHTTKEWTGRCQCKSIDTEDNKRLNLWWPCFWPLVTGGSSLQYTVISWHSVAICGWTLCKLKTDNNRMRIMFASCHSASMH